MAATILGREISELRAPRVSVTSETDLFNGSMKLTLRIDGMEISTCSISEMDISDAKNQTASYFTERMLAGIRTTTECLLDEDFNNLRKHIFGLVTQAMKRLPAIPPIESTRRPHPRESIAIALPSLSLWAKIKRFFGIVPPQIPSAKVYRND